MTLTRGERTALSFDLACARRYSLLDPPQPWVPPVSIPPPGPPPGTFMTTHLGLAAWCVDPWCPPDQIWQVDAHAMHPGWALRRDPRFWIIGSRKSFDALLAVNIAAAYRPEGL